MTRRQTLAQVDRLLTIMEQLRGADGCPWDARQTPQSLRPYLLEETYELLEALDRDDPGAIRDELGDVLLQIVFHSAIFAERSAFDFGHVAKQIADKLERRHPHVFATSHGISHEDHHRQWELIKATESPVGNRDTGLASGIPLALPALARTAKIAERALRRDTTCFDRNEIYAELSELLAPLAATPPPPPDVLAHCIGRSLLLLACLAATSGLDPESTLREALARFLHDHTQSHSLTTSRESGDEIGG